MTEVLEPWKDFNVAMVGATAALAGLVIVAASVNISRIVTARTITARLAAAIATLVLALVASGVGLVPGISAPWYGTLVAVVAVVAGVFQAHATIRIAREHASAFRLKFFKAALGFVPIAAYFAAGVVTVAAPRAGLALAAGGCLAAIASAIVISWVALVEVLR
ncbi:hypothetical protein [Rhodococcus chondri]|uniref:Modulator of FtsH protease n=1 Tax=Rhodococcus chondri TaxID=3065941 RepID=A0ABU7JPL7_9NOCA|nr:hypothetical protein [Rhodococcus sp. CC-R104]MEE2031978.1 hypothetical protein [Rhodococcus sp. CC-R104]